MADDPHAAAPPTRFERHRAARIDRRELLIAVGTLAAALGLPKVAFAQAAMSTTEFAALTSAIAGNPPNDPAITAEFLAAFSDQTADLIRLHEIVAANSEDEWPAAIAAANLTPLAEALSTAWYTGMVGAGADQRVVTYLEAFAWYALTYTKPPTRCDLSFGAWSEPPRVVR